MLHVGILPNHDRFAELLGNLTHVVIDEAHVYRGVFGSHVANVIRRLQRICRYYGSAPQFVFTSATIANPGELAENLIGEPATVVSKSGAPSGERLFMLYNPPILNIEDGRRQSPGSAAQQLVVPLLEMGAGAIVFARSRQGVEVLTRRIRESLVERRKKELASRVDGYRGGYLPEDRRRIERGLRAGTIRGVITTNALELGIDIGALDVAVLAGYPGTIASTWQQAGRAGRRQTTALVVLVAILDSSRSAAAAAAGSASFMGRLGGIRAGHRAKFVRLRESLTAGNVAARRVEEVRREREAREAEKGMERGSKREQVGVS
jgi:DEAD/DEAH box helicase domain-containing protein